ncbi:hypothetical protein F5Y09DRAFT_347142 [Xylaria sp. FL1042]|nr:hypothetical protein F5Y09DRAFT_347142 [Xylaria sp. FL1042]
MAKQQSEPIAIIGSGCRFPGGSNSPSKLWELLREPRDVLRTVPLDRYDTKSYYHPEPTHHGTSDVQESYFLDEDPYVFDNNLFNMQPGECEAADPQQRMLLETVYDSLCAAGLTIESLRGSSTSVFVGLMCDDWSGLMTRDWDSYPTYASTGMGRSIMSNRISYFFDWHGPSMTIDTACSSSLVAVHQAVQTLLSGESRVALAAGSNLILSPAMYIAESNLRMLSPTGRSRMWDADADGYARGEGVAAVFMKTLSAALEDGDHIECIIRATALNQDGRTPGLTMPSGTAQADLIRETYARAGLDILNPKDRPQFFHAHGTGTAAGDPQEAEAIAQAFFPSGGPWLNQEKLCVGSVKTIIGHTEGTAGLASLIASVQALRNSTIPPNMHFNNLSPKVAPFYNHLEVPTVARPWPELAPGQERRISINSFGFGGANVHAIIESYSPPPLRTTILSGTTPIVTPFVFSAASAESLRTTLERYQSYLQQNDEADLRSLAYTLHSRRSTLPYRKAIAASNIQRLVENIDLALKEANDSQSSLKQRYFNKPDARILGVFTGQGAQWPRMGAQLLQNSPLVADIIERLDRYLANLPPSSRPRWTIKDELLAHEESSRLSKAEIAQPLCTAVQIVLVDLLRLAGITLHAVVGHSSGEIGAAYASGLISAESAIKVAYYRGFYANLARSPNAEKKGAMLAVGTSIEDAEEFCMLESFEGRIQVAACNSLSSVTLSGDEDAIDEALEIFKDEQVFARKLRVDTAYHSHHMEMCAAPYLEAITPLTTAVSAEEAPTWHSSVVPGQKMSNENLEAEYWVKNMVKPVLFSSAIGRAVTESGPFDLVLEIGPHPALKGPCLNSLDEANHPTVPYLGMLSRGQDDMEEVASSFGHIWENLGVGILQFDNLDQSFTGDTERKQVVTDLPLYPFNHSRSFRSLSRISAAQINNHAPVHPLLGRRCVETQTAQEVQWRNIIRPKEISWLQCHRLQGQIVFAATAYVAMAIDSIALLSEGTPRQFELEGLEIGRAITFDDEDSGVETLFTMKTVHSDDHEMVAEFACYSSISNESPMARNAHGRVTVRLGETDEVEQLPLLHPETYNLADIEVDRFYNSLFRLGYGYESPFNCIRSIKRKLGYSTGTIEDESGSAWEDQLIVHPGMMDTALQTVSAAYCCPGDGRLFTIHVPTRIDRLIIDPQFTSLGSRKQKLIPYQSVVRESIRGETTADVHLFCEDGSQAFIQVEGMHLRPFSVPRAEDDAVMFAEFRYRAAIPDGTLAVAGEKPTPADVEKATDLERISFYYLQNLLKVVTKEEQEETLPHYQRLLHWASHVQNLVREGKHLTLSTENEKDTPDLISGLISKHSEEVDAKLVRAVGENLPAVIKSRGNILEFMTKDGVLNDFYGIETANNWIARMVGQLAHRYPRMQILEIGAGTGGSTRVILPELAAAFSSYTYTDISSAFFEAAEQRFDEYAERMVFKTFDMEKTPADQGFMEGAYDLVIAANVLHATDKLEDTMTHVRQLLRPGGFLVMFEVVSNDALRIGLPMGGLPGWWIGAESGRPWGPTLTVPQWDTLLQKCGFSGIDTVTPPYHDLHPGAVFATMAVDQRVSSLRAPLSPQSGAPATKSTTLSIIGGKTPEVRGLIETVAPLVKSRYQDIVILSSVEDISYQHLPEGSSVLSLTELDEPLFKDVTLAKHESLKRVWKETRNILWITKGCRSDNPHSFMTVGLGRAMRAEHPNINLQMLDVEKIDGYSGSFIAEHLIRMELLDIYARDKSGAALMWSAEPEIVMEGGHSLIPRLYPRKDANLRHNSGRRQVTEEVNPQTANFEMHESDSAIILKNTSPLRWLSTSPLQTATIRVSHSLLQSVHVKDVGYVMLCAGTDTKTNESVIAMSLSAETPAPAPPSWVATLPLVEPSSVLLSVAADIVARSTLAIVPPRGVLLVHEADPAVAAALVSHALEMNIRLVLTTSQKKYPAPALYVHPKLPQRLIKRAVPQDATTFIDFSQASMACEVGRWLTDYLPQNCVVANASMFLGKKVAVLSNPTIEVGQSVLREALANISALALSESSVVPLSKTPPNGWDWQRLTIVEWTSGPVSIDFQAIDDGFSFGPDKTYLLAGLAGELGQSLAQWMVHRGAKHIVLTSRRPNVKEELLQSLAKKGAELRVLSCDVTNRASLRACIDEIERTMPRIAGVANGAMVLRDAMFENMSFDQMMTCLRPKVDGTILLDEMFYDAPLDFFIVFSSLTAVVGNSGQSNYAAANMFMTALASQRKKRGVAGSTIDISSLMGIGYVERSDTLDADYFTKLGYTNISEQDFHQLFAEAIAAGRPGSDSIEEIVTGVSPIYSDQDVKAQFLTDLKFAHFVLERPEVAAQANRTQSVPVRVRLADAAPEDVEDIIKDSLMIRLKRTLQLGEDETVNDSVSLVEQGIDSLMAVEVRTWFIKELDVDMPVLKILAGGTIRDLVSDAASRLPQVGANIPPSHDDMLATASPGAETDSSHSKLPSSSSSDIATASSSLEDISPPPESKTLSFDESIVASRESEEIKEQLSYGQARFWFMQNLLADPKSFNMAVMFQLLGPLRVDAFERAVQIVVQRHEILRTRLVQADEGDDLDDCDEPLQGISSKSAINLTRKRITRAEEAHEELRRMRDEEWDLHSWESMKITLVSLSDTVHYVVVGSHHITLDGMSFSVLFVDLEAAYSGKPLPPLSPTSQYRAFASKQRRDYESGAMRESIEAFRRAIPSDVKPLPLLPFATVSKRQPVYQYELTEAKVKLDKEEGDRIKQFARKCRSTTFHVFMSVLQAQLFQYIPEMDGLCIGMADANRLDHRFMGTMGFLLNLLPLYFSRSPKGTRASHVVQGTRDKVYAALQHSQLPFDVLLQELSIPRSAEHTPLFQVFVDYRQIVQERSTFGECRLGEERWLNAATGYDIRLEVTENPNGEVLLAMNLQSCLYSQKSTEMLLESYVKLLGQYCSGADVMVEELAL